MNNPFDSMPGIPDKEEMERIKAGNEELGNKLDNLIHRAFKESQSGAELLELWTDALITRSSVTGSMTPLEVGMEEGKREFIRNIILTIRKVEGEQ